MIFGFVFGALKTYIRCLYMHFLNKKMSFNYNKLLASNILESMRVVNLSKIENDIATFTWINIPIVSQDAKIEIISKFEVVIDLKTKQSISCLTGPCSNIYLEITLIETEDKSEIRIPRVVLIQNYQIEIITFTLNEFKGSSNGSPFHF